MALQNKKTTILQPVSRPFTSIPAGSWNLSERENGIGMGVGCSGV